MGEFNSVFTSNDGLVSLLLMGFFFFGVLFYFLKAGRTIQTSFLLTSFFSSFASFIMWLIGWLNEEFMVFSFILLAFAYILNWMSTG